MQPTIKHHGGASGVTGSCHELALTDHQSLLIDCGLFQGADQARDRFEQLTIGFDTGNIAALVITHVHIDHVGRLPYLIAAGYQGPIYCSIPSSQLLPLVIEDALAIGFTQDQQLIKQFSQRLARQIRPLPYQRWQAIESKAGQTLAHIKLKPAGHILGSSYVEVRHTVNKQPWRTVFSGDLGTSDAPILPAPKAPAKCNTLVLESTYGDKYHAKGRQQALQAAIAQALPNNGTVLIPAFSIGRTQTLLYELENLLGQWPNVDIVLDSPLAASFTKVYRALKPYWDKEAKNRLKQGRHPLNFDQLITVKDHPTHQRMVSTLATQPRAAIVIAASGMCAGGRIVNYLKAMLEDPRHHVLFVGYQAQGTPGRDIQRYGPSNGWVELDGQRYTINASVQTIGGYSAHGDQQDLLNFVTRMRQPPQDIRLVHGEPAAKAALKNALSAFYQTKQKSVVISCPSNEK